MEQCPNCGEFFESPKTFTAHRRDEPNCVQLSPTEIELSKRMIDAEIFDRNQQKFNGEQREECDIGFGEYF